LLRARMAAAIAGETEQLHLTLTKEADDKWGMVIGVVTRTGSLGITDIHQEGLIKSWNDEHPDAKVCAGQWIAAVNGVSGHAGNMMAELQRTGEMHVVVSRRDPAPIMQVPRMRGMTLPPPSGDTRQFRVTLEKEEGLPLGCNLHMGLRAMTIVEIRDGCIRDWNEKHPRREIKVGDRIVRVNGSGRRTMISEISKSGTLNIVLRRGQIEEDAGVEGSPEDIVPMRMVKEFPQFEWTKQCKRGEEEACGICLQDWEVGDQAMRLPCKHHFHPECITPWLTQRSAHCPLCNWAADCDVSQEEDCEHDVGEDVGEPVPKPLPPAMEIRLPRPRCHTN